MAKDPKTEEQKAAKTKPKTRTPYRGSDRYYEDVLEKQKKTRPGYPDYQRYQEILNLRPKKAGPAKTASGFGAAFRTARNDYLNDRSKKKTFEWDGNEYHVRIKKETPAQLETQRKKTLSGAFSKKGAKKTFRQRRLARLKKRAAATTAKGRTKHLQKRIQRVSGRISATRKNKKKPSPVVIPTFAAGGVATDDLGLRNRPEKRAVRAMKPGAGKSVAAKVKRTSVPKNKKNMDLAPKRRKGASIKGYQGGGAARYIGNLPGDGLGRRIRALPKAAGQPYLATNTGEPTNVRQRPGGMKKGGMAKKPRGVGAAKRGYGKALS